MQITPGALNKKAEVIKGTLAFSLLEYRLPQAIKRLQMASQKRTEKDKRVVGGLEQSMAVISGIGIIGALFFLSSNFTGNAIGNMTNSTSSIIGAVLLVIGLVSGYFWVKGKK